MKANVKYQEMSEEPTSKYYEVSFVEGKITPKIADHEDHPKIIREPQNILGIFQRSTN